MGNGCPSRPVVGFAAFFAYADATVTPSFNISVTVTMHMPQLPKRQKPQLDALSLIPPCAERASSIRFFFVKKELRFFGSH